MAQRIENSFTTYVMSEAETERALTLSPETKMYLQNMLAVVAHERLNIKFDHLDKEKFIQEEAYYQAKKDFIMQLQAEIIETEERVKRRLIEGVNSEEQQPPQSPDII